MVLTTDALHLYRKVRKGKRFFVEGQPKGYALGSNVVDLTDIAAVTDECKVVLEESFAHQMLHLHYKDSDVMKLLTSFTTWKIRNLTVTLGITMIS